MSSTVGLPAFAAQWMGFEARKAGGYEDPDKIPVITRWTAHARGIRTGCHAFRKYHNGMLSGQWTTNPHLTRTHRIVVELNRFAVGIEKGIRTAFVFDRLL